MKPHQELYKRMVELLDSKFGDSVVKYEDGDHVTIWETGIWLSVDESELTVGFDVTHTHYHEKYDDMNLALNRFINLITNRIRITQKRKGNLIYWEKNEIELADGETDLIGSVRHEEIGTSLTWFAPFWKKTKEVVSYTERLIDRKEIEQEIE
jgi:hypothetical protein